MKKLFLQIFSSGRNNHPLARSNDWHQISQRLAGSGAGFNDQVAAFFERLLDCLRHLQLPAPKFVGRMCLREHSARSKKLVERGAAFRDGDSGLRTGRHRVSIIAASYASAQTM